MDEILILAVDVVFFGAGDLSYFVALVKSDQVQLVLGDEEDLVEVVLPDLDVVVIELKHYYVLALHLEGPLEVHDSCSIYEGLAFYRIARVVLQKFLAVLDVLVVYHCIRFESFEFVVSDSLEV